MDETKNWKVFSEGKIQTNADLNLTLVKLQNTFKISAQKATSLISNTRILVKSCSSEDEAKRYLQTLEGLGVIASMEETGSSVAPSLSPMDDKTAPQTHSEVGSKHLIRCPRCQTEQSVRTECRSCGIIIAQFIKEQQDLDYKNNAPNSIDSNNLFKRNPILIVCAVVILSIFYSLFSSPKGIPIGSSILAKQQITSLNHARELPALSSDEIRQLLVASDFDRLEKIIDHMNSSLEYDIQWEYPLFKTLEYLSSKYGVRESHLNNWVKTKSSPLSYLARAYYYTNEGWLSREKKYASSTSIDKFLSFKEYHAKAYDDFKKARSSNPKLLAIYTGLISISRSQQQIDPRPVLEDAIQLFPGGFSFRSQYGYYIMPKWFGSKRLQKSFEEEIEEILHLNPRLSVILGFRSSEIALQAKNNNQIDQCIKHYNEALEYGVKAIWLHKRAYCLMKDGQYSASISDAELSLQMEYNKHVVNIKTYSEGKL